MILDKFLNESSFEIMGNHEPAECPLSESALLTPDSLGIANAKAMGERETMKLEKAVLYAESVIYVNGVKGADTRMLSENVVTDFFKKMYEMLKKAWGRMVEWFKNLFKAIEISLRDASKALDGVEGKLNSKNMDEFKYHAHDWKSPSIHETMAKNAKTKIEQCKSSVSTALNNVKVAADPDSAKNTRDEDERLAKAYNDADEEVNAKIAYILNGSVGEMTMEEAKDKIREMYGTDKSANENTGLDSGTYNPMIKFMKEFKNNDILKKAQKNVDDNYKSALDKVKQTQSAIESNKGKTAATADNKKNSDANHNKYLAIVKKDIAGMAKYIDIYDSLMGCCIDQEKAKFKEYKGIIISAVRYSPKKDK